MPGNTDSSWAIWGEEIALNKFGANNGQDTGWFVENMNMSQDQLFKNPCIDIDVRDIWQHNCFFYDDFSAWNH